MQKRNQCDIYAKYSCLLQNYNRLEERWCKTSERLKLLFSDVPIKKKEATRIVTEFGEHIHAGRSVERGLLLLFFSLYMGG